MLREIKSESIIKSIMCLLLFLGHHRHYLCDWGEPNVSELTEHVVQPHADDVSEHPGQSQPQRQRRGWFSGGVPHVQSIPAPLLLHGP